MERRIGSAEIICTGTELLLGEVTNTNAGYLARGLAELGIPVLRQSVVGDDPVRLAEELRAALCRADLVLLSGGLGPTEDDLTKETAADVLGLPMQLHAHTLERIEAYFETTGREMTANNRKQAMIPEGATVLDNDYGTAPALAVEDREGRLVLLLPGPPRELEPLFSTRVMPLLAGRSGTVLRSHSLRICGMGESAIEAALPSSLLHAENPTVALYCGAGEVRLRVSARAADAAGADALCDRAIGAVLASPVGKYVYGRDVESAQAALVSELAARGLTLATAESCTGGLIAKRLTDVAGCSSVIAGGAVTYQTREKVAVLHVPQELIDAHTVVSREVALAMARGALARMDVDVAIAITGYAGPGGGTPQEPVGTVCLAVAVREGATPAVPAGGLAVCRRLSLSPLRDRAYIREAAATHALVEALRCLREL